MAEPGLLTLGRWVRDWGRISTQRVAIEFLGRQVTYAELDAGSERRAAALLAAGLRRGLMTPTRGIGAPSPSWRQEGHRLY